MVELNWRRSRKPVNGNRNVNQILNQPMKRRKKVNKRIPANIQIFYWNFLHNVRETIPNQITTHTFIHRVKYIYIYNLYDTGLFFYGTSSYEDGKKTKCIYNTIPVEGFYN